MNTITIKTSEIKSESIEQIMEEIMADESLLMRANQIASYNNWSIAEAIEAIATHISINDEDYNVEIMN